MSTAMYVLGGAVGLAFGSLAAYLNSLITKHYLRKNMEKRKPEGTAAVMGLSLVRQLVNIAALAIVFFVRDYVPLPFSATIVGTAVGLTAVSFFHLENLKKSAQ